jgi:hypothetical protein
MRNEPVHIPASMGASTIAGYNNWDRIRQYRQAWEAQQTWAASETAWQEEFKRLVPQKDLYQDRFILLSNGPYSCVSAPALGLSAPEWHRLSLIIRQEHECTHYFTRRVFASMRNNLLDELIADYMGIVAACGAFRADWFLHFVGLEDFPHYRQGGRLENYRGQPPLSAGAFIVLQRLVKAAAEQVEHFDRTYVTRLRQPEARPAIIMVLSRFTLEELAVESSQEALAHALEAQLAMFA